MSQEETTRRRAAVMQRVRERQERHRRRNRIYRIGFALIGFLVLLAGFIMLFTPGPGWAVIVLGLAMLALEFAWAERLLDRTLKQMERAAEQVTRGSPVRRATVLAIGAAVAVAAIAIIIVWDIPFFPG